MAEEQIRSATSATKLNHLIHKYENTTDEKRRYLIAVQMCYLLYVKHDDFIHYRSRSSGRRLIDVICNKTREMVDMYGKITPRSSVEKRVAYKWARMTNRLYESSRNNLPPRVQDSATSVYHFANLWQACPDHASWLWLYLCFCVAGKKSCIAIQNRTGAHVVKTRYPNH